MVKASTVAKIAVLFAVVAGSAYELVNFFDKEPQPVVQSTQELNSVIAESRELVSQNMAKPCAKAAAEMSAIMLTGDLKCDGTKVIPAP